METFGYVILPGLAVFLFAMAVLIWILWVAVPKAKHIRLENKEIQEHVENRKELNVARSLLARLAIEAEDDQMLEVSLGKSYLDQIKAFTNKELSR